MPLPRTRLPLAALLILGWLASLPSALAQSTTLTAQIQDANGNLFGSGSYNVSFFVPTNYTGQPTSGGHVVAPDSVVGKLDSSGNMSIVLLDNNQISPLGTQWTFSFCASDGTHCFSTNQTVTGATQNLTNTFKALAPLFQVVSLAQTVNSLTVTGAITGASVAVTGAVTGASETVTSSGLFSNAGNNFYSQSLINGCNPGTEFSSEQGGLFTTDSMTGCVTIPSSSTQFNSNAVSGYVNNSSTTTYGIGGYFSGRALADAVKINTLNAVLSDAAPFRVTGYGLNIGINFLNGSSCCGAVLIEGGSTVQPSALRFSAIEFAPAGSGIKWKTLLHQQTAASPYLLNLDDASPEALNVNVGSTGNRYFSVFDGANADAGNLVMQSGTQTSPANGYFFQARNALGANNTAYPILLNPLGGNVGVGVTNAVVALDVSGSIRVSNQLTSSVATGTAPLQITSTTPVVNLTAGPATYNSAGTQLVNSHIVVGSCTLGTDCAITLAGAAVFTGTGSYFCSPVDTTAAAAVRLVKTSGSVFTFTGTGTDALNYVCAGN